MSNSENPKNVANFSARLPALVAGVLPGGTQGVENLALFANLNNCSVIQGLVRTTPGGVVAGIPRVSIGNVTTINANQAPPVSVFAPVNTDTSIYTLFWQNEVYPNANVC
jgi:hypothetical protein